MKPRLTCFDCKEGYRLAKIARVAAKNLAALPSSANLAPITMEPLLLCRVCGESIPEPCGPHDHNLKINIKNGTMSRRKTCFACKAEAKLFAKLEADATNRAPDDSKVIEFATDCYILRTPSLSSTRTNKILKAGKEAKFTNSIVMHCSSHDGTPRSIVFFRLADGRGWVHNSMDEPLPAPDPLHSSASPIPLSVASVTAKPTASPLSSSTMFSIRYDADGPGVAIRVAPLYPGTRTCEQIYAGQIVAVSEFRSIIHIDADDKPHTIIFYRLADGRGWVHDFCPTSSTVAFSRVPMTPPSSPATVASVTAEPTAPPSRPPSPPMTSRFDSPWPPGTPLAEQVLFTPDDYRRFISYARFPLHLMKTQTHADSTSPLQSR